MTAKEDSALRAANQEETRIIQEGQASCTVSKSVFYNPVQEINRDLSILFLQCMANRHSGEQPIKLLESLAASGLRAARYATELPKDKFCLHANDHDVNAFQSLKDNLKELPVTVHCADACDLLRRQMMFNVVDIDPYGSPARFLESAVLGLRRPGVLMLTATDAAVLCGAGPAQRACCLDRYSSLPLPNNSSCHEFGIRILIYALAQHCARMNASLTPLLSMSVDFYFRLFVQLKRTQADSRNQMLDMCGYCIYCPNCRSTQIRSIRENETLCAMTKCEFCKTGLKTAGPLWIGQIHCQETVNEMLEQCLLADCKLHTKPRIVGILSIISEELNKSPLYFVPSHLCKCLKVITPSTRELRSAIVNAGYAVSSTHCSKEGLKTDAPYSVIWTLLQHWAAKHPSKKDQLTDYERNLREYKITTEPTIDFTYKVEAQSKAKLAGLKRFPPNPQSGWGPAKRPCLRPLTRQG